MAEAMECIFYDAKRNKIIVVDFIDVFWGSFSEAQSKALRKQLKHAIYIGFT